MPEPKGPRPDEPDRGREKAEAPKGPAYPWAVSRERPEADLLETEYRLREEAETRRPFAAVLDLADKSWRFASPTLAEGWAPPAAGPEAFLADAVRAVVHQVLRAGRFDPKDVMIDARARYLHVAGFASAADIRQPVCRDLLRTYLGSLKGGGSGEGLVIRPVVGSRIDVTFKGTPGPTLPPAPVPDAGSLGHFPAGTAAAVEALRLALVARHQQVVATVQQVLDRLAGSHAPDIEANRAVAAAVNALTDDYGVALLYDGRPVTLRVLPVRRDPAGSFQVRLTGSDQKALKTSMAFPPLIAVSKATVNRPPTPGSGEANAPPAE